MGKKFYLLFLEDLFKGQFYAIEYRTTQSRESLAMEAAGDGVEVYGTKKELRDAYRYYRREFGNLIDVNRI